MTKAQEFLSVITPLQVYPPENIKAVLEMIAKNRRITFFSWKMFQLKKQGCRLTADPNFDQIVAEKYITAEKAFIQTLLDLNIRFAYVKLIPDELPQVFFNFDTSTTADTFTNEVAGYFKSIYPPTKVIKMTDLLVNPLLCRLYNRVYKDSMASKINPDKFQKEVDVRSTYYSSKPLPKDAGIKLAIKAFRLFAAETAVIVKAFQNPVLLAGSRSVDTYKYEFFKYPKNRTILPKLFVL
ncbi:MAG: hypothetical protein AAB548_00035 [Patescibacteria group bacterium]